MVFLHTFALQQAPAQDTVPRGQVAQHSRGIMSIFERFRLTGKRLFITGGSRGLGREMALAIADAGADVILVGRDAPSLEQTAADIGALGRRASIIQADVSLADECE